MHLKPTELPRLTQFNTQFIDNLNVEILVDCLSMGDYENSSLKLNRYRKNSYNKRAYDSLPKAIKYGISEFIFDMILFSYDSFYHYNTDINEIYKEYCEYILISHPNAKSVKKYYAKLKINSPELFI